MDLMTRKLNFKEGMLLIKILKNIDINSFVDKVDFDDLFQLLIKGSVHLFTNLHLAENEIKQLIMSYKNLKDMDFDSLDCDDIVDILKDIFQNGVPTIVKNFLKKDVLSSDEAKKKLEEIKQKLKLDIPNKI
jgi:hypothetical protein